MCGELERAKDSYGEVKQSSEPAHHSTWQKHKDKREEDKLQVGELQEANIVIVRLEVDEGSGWPEMR